VPLRLTQREEIEPTEQGTARRIRAGDVVGMLQKVNKTCLEHRREGVRRTICKVCSIFLQRYHRYQLLTLKLQIAAQTLVREKDYGLAVSYCTSAEDWRGLGGVVDRVLEEYIISGRSILHTVKLIVNG